ncbi:anti-sigma factor family protein [Profundibacter sp.]
MNAPTFSDEELMAYADGQLDETRAADLDFALSSDEVLADRLALFADTRASVAAAYAPMLDEPVPDALMQSIRQMAKDSDAALVNSNVVAFQPRFTQPVWQMAVAASIALLIGFGGGLFMGKPQSAGGLGLGTLDNPDILAALSNLRAGEQRTLKNGDKIVMVETFRDDSDAVCREFEYQHSGAANLVAVTCYDNGWAVKLALATPSAGTGYAPASALPTLDAYLNTIGAKAPLSLEEEQQILADLRETANP